MERIDTQQRTGFTGAEGVVWSVPIRLSPKASRMLPFARVKLVIRRGDSFTSDSEQGAKRVERIEPSVEAKREFIEVSL